MIIYNRSAFGWRLIFRIHGSAIYRSVLPSLIALGLYFVWENLYPAGVDPNLLHPYAVGALIASTTFLIVFKLNQGYSRYWEACGSIHHMTSKWMDATTHASVFHMQCDHYQHIKPPSFYHYPELNFLNMTRDRERGVDYNELFEDDPLFEDDDYVYNGNYSQFSKASTMLRQSTVAVVPGLRNRRQRERTRSRHGTERTSSRTSSGFTPTIPPSPSRFSSMGSMSRGDTNSSSGGNNGNGNIVRVHSDDEGGRVTSIGCSSVEGVAKTRRKRRKSEKKHREIRSIVKSINYIENPNKREKAHRYTIVHPTSILPPSATGSGGSMHFSTSDHEAYGDDAGGDSYSDTESHYFEHHLHNISKLGRGGKGQTPIPLWGRPRLDGNWGKYFTINPERPLSTYVDPRNPDHIDDKGFASMQGGHTPALFLQEMAHLASLLIAVALSTLRNDIEGAESPLAMYEPGKPWPEVDPDKAEPIKKDGLSSIRTKIKTFLSIGKTPEERTRWNAARPLPVIGGVSDAEIRFLQTARGPYAKTQLCWNWLSEFIIREHLAGSMGKVGPPIISRLIQFLSDGMIYYNHARKIMWTPFPFVHAQLVVLFILLMIPVVPYLMAQYTDSMYVGAFLTFFTVLCVSGINEVSRELENPFRNVPNELPLVTFQAQANEALYTMYAGFHPDLFWDGDRVLRYSNTTISPQNREDIDIKKSPPLREEPQIKKESKKSTEIPSNDSRITEVTNETIECSSSTSLALGEIAESPVESDSLTRDDENGKKDSIIVETVAHCEKDQDNKERKNETEIAELKRQLADQAKLIEKLFAKVGAANEL